MYDNFFYKAKQTVYKWWCVIYKPVYKLTHHGYWPAEKEPYYIPPEEKQQQQLASQMTKQISDTEAEISLEDTTAKDTVSVAPTNNTTSSNDNPSNTGESAEDAAARAKEIMDRLNREAAEDEAKKQAEIEAARQKAAEQDRLNSILKSTQRDISQYISEGMAHREEAQHTIQEETPTASDEALRRAQEIMDRLNREAAEDESKKQAEIEAAKEYARKNNL